MKWLEMMFKYEPKKEKREEKIWGEKTRERI
jgi:hypothetical protein